MEILVLILSSLISVLSPLNFAADKVAENAVRSQFKAAEVVKVRIDSAPLHNPILGKADKLRIATRGVYPLKSLRIDTIELETDPINISRQQLAQKRGKLLLEEQLGIATRIVIKKDDVVKAILSPEIIDQIQKLLGGSQKTKAFGLPDLKDFRLSNPKVEFLENQRVRLEAEIEQLSTAEKLKIEAETGLEFLDGQRLQLIKPTLSINGQPIPPEFLDGILATLTRELDLKRFETLLQVKARVFKFQFKDDQLEVAAFILLPKGLKL